MLSKALRFNFIDIYNIMSAVRKNAILQSSQVFVDCYDREYHQRFNLDANDWDQSPWETLHYCGDQRKNFNKSIVENQGRLKIIKSGLKANIAISEEILRWTLDSKIPPSTTDAFLPLKI